MVVSMNKPMGIKMNNLYFSDLVSDAVKFLCDNEPPDGYFLGFSGGKDSTVIYHLAVLSGVKFQSYFTNTGLEAPETVKHVKEFYPEVVCLRPKINFFQGMKTNGMPYRNRRWCCTILKEQPSHKIPLIHRVFGIRAEESPKRAAYGAIKFNKKFINYHPIFFWNEGMVWDFIDYYNLPYNPLYDLGFSRVGCMICLFLSSGQLNYHRKHFEKFYTIFYKKLEEFWDSGCFKSKMTKEFFLKWPLWDFKANPHVTIKAKEAESLSLRLSGDKDE